MHDPMANRVGLGLAEAHQPVDSPGERGASRRERFALFGQDAAVPVFHPQLALR